MSNDFYIISTNSYIKNVSKYLDMDFYENDNNTTGVNESYQLPIKIKNQ